MSNDKEFFELLKNEGMDGILKKYTPVEHIVDEQQEIIAKLQNENEILNNMIILIIQEITAFKFYQTQCPPDAECDIGKDHDKCWYDWARDKAEQERKISADSARK